MKLLLEKLLVFVQEVSDFRDEDGALPFNVIDYYAMEDLLEDLKTAIREIEKGGT